MGRRIHVVGSSPRTGTTLMTELLVSCFEVDGYTEHEMSIFVRPRQHFELFCSKHPKDVLEVGPLLRLDKDLWVVHMERDPRDVIVSRHQRDPGRYWTNLRLWKSYRRAARRLAGHPRFVSVRYEDLVADPEAVQRELMGRMPFLRRRGSFRDFHRTARPSEKARVALGEIRPISAASVGAWRQNKPRLAAQLALHGPIDQDLVELGYERDDGWRRELQGVVPDNDSSRWPERRTVREFARHATRRTFSTLRYALGLSRRVTLAVPRAPR